jgi:hypothetical protein
MKTKTITSSYLRKQVSSVYRLPGAAGLQNTSLYSALRASLRLFKFNPIEFSPAYAGMTG